MKPKRVIIHTEYGPDDMDRLMDRATRVLLRYSLNRPVEGQTVTVRFTGEAIAIYHGNKKDLAIFGPEKARGA